MLYLASLQILEPQAVFLLVLRDAAVCCNSRSDSISPCAKASHSLTEPPSYFTVGVIQELQFFHHLRDPLIWRKDFELLFVRPKDFFTLLHVLSSLCARWPTGAFWHWFASSTVVSWQQIYRIGQLHRVFSSQWMVIHFVTTLVQLCSNVWSSHPSVTQSDEIFLCICKTDNTLQTVIKLNI